MLTGTTGRSHEIWIESSLRTIHGLIRIAHVERINMTGGVALQKGCSEGVALPLFAGRWSWVSLSLISLRSDTRGTAPLNYREFPMLPLPTKIGHL